jgi:putative heme transporter
VRRWFSKRALLGLAGAVLIVATFAYLLPTIADYRDVWRVVKSVSWEWAVALVAVTGVNILTFAPPWLVLLPGLRFWPTLMMTQAATALSIVVPGGAAAGIATAYGMLRRSGFAPGAVARSVTLVSLWNQFANLAFPILALFLLTMAGDETAVLATAAFVGVAILGVAVGALVLVLYSNRMAAEIGDLAARGATRVKGRFQREPVKWSGTSFERFRVDVVDILERRWHLLTVATLAGSLTVFVVLLVSLRALQVPSAEVSAAEAFAAWSLARILGSIPITPGGIGIVELSLTAALIGFGGNNAGVVAAVLVYRFLTIVPTLVLGVVAAAVWRRLLSRAPASGRDVSGAEVVVEDDGSGEEIR